MIISQLQKRFCWLSLWFGTTLATGVLYRLVLNSLFFEFPIFVLLIQSSIGLTISQLTANNKTEEKWSFAKIRYETVLTTFALTGATYLNYISLYKESATSNILRYSLAPCLVYFSLRTLRNSRLLLLLAIFSTIIVSYATSPTVPLVEVSFESSSLYGISNLLFSLLAVALVRQSVNQSCVKDFLSGHFIVSSSFLFLLEIFQHEIRPMTEYLLIWRQPNFFTVLLTFLLCSLSSFYCFCRVLQEVDLATVGLAFNALGACEFVLVNYLYENVADKKVFEPISSSTVFLAFLSVLLMIFGFWKDRHPRNVEKARDSWACKESLS
ncbi:unnamed protein product [Caenorhabditis auriculariae]|uniref:Uncharacterized protein n=1 Tax=Caenorhabditis auriculariae TaxID=2777116 RepID=A0A8S1HF62_9PELO|nr:unnamed protein product [Caenorhabditis auriculariae]